MLKGTPVQLQGWEGQVWLRSPWLPGSHFSPLTSLASDTKELICKEPVCPLELGPTCCTKPGPSYPATPCHTQDTGQQETAAGLKIYFLF